MFAPGHKVGSGDDVWINGMPKSQWYAQNPTQKPTEFYDEAHPYLPAGFTAAPTAQTPAGNGSRGATSPTLEPPTPGVASPVDPMAPRAEARNPIYSNMATQLSPTTMTALSGYQAQMPQRKKQFGGISGLPFGRNLYGGAFT